MQTTQVALEFQKVVACAECAGRGDGCILRDDTFNLPQPGYVGADYAGTRVLLVGQNPGVSPDRFAQQDREYAAALCAVRDNPSTATMTALQAVLDRIIPTWPVSGNYFPLAECSLSLGQIAYLNLVRCRTRVNAAPSCTMVSNCVRLHFGRWLDFLKPRVVVCVGKWAHDRTAGILDARGIPHAFMNRQRSLATTERQRNRMEVVDLVRTCSGQVRFTAR